MGGQQISIEELTRQETVLGTDIVPISSGTNRCTRGVMMSAIAAYVGSLFSFADGKVTVYAVPTVSPFVVTGTSLSTSMWLIISPTIDIAALTIPLPGDGVATDNQEVLVCTTRLITALTVDSGTLGKVGAPTTLAAGASFRMRYNGVNKVWYMVT